MATVLVTPLAEEDLGDIWDYAAESDVERADRLLDLIYENCQRLAEYPEMGRARHELLVSLRSFTVKITSSSTSQSQTASKCCACCTARETSTTFSMRWSANWVMTKTEGVSFFIRPLLTPHGP